MEKNYIEDLKKILTFVEKHMGTTNIELMTVYKFLSDVIKKIEEQ